MSKKEVDAYLALSAELDATARAHGNDSKEADGVRDRMDAPWYALDEDDLRKVDRALRNKEAPEQLTRLFNACVDDVDYRVLEELCFRSGLLWRCKCGYNNHEEDEVCADCGVNRPKEAA